VAGFCVIGMLQHAAVCCSVLQHVAMCGWGTCDYVLHCNVACCSVLQCITVCGWCTRVYTYISMYMYGYIHRSSCR